VVKLRKSATNNNWYALFAITGEEDKVKERLEYRLRDRNLRVIVPKRKIKERSQGKWTYKIRTLFPGYILLNGFLGIEEYYMLNNVPGLLRILKNESKPYIIDKNEIEVINTLIKDNEIIEPSYAMFTSGKIIVINGPLSGLEGLIESINKRKGRVKVRLGLNGNKKLIDLSIELVEPV
jgi:transcriptional antiterminator NusG